ncbi:MAG: nitrogenase iron-molybdenum cofactor biosynthesis protein NifN [Terracidiphilus sp.]|jgi:nitrogenase molybdenum-iron protein NifN
MARVTISDKFCTVNPLKMSPSIGATLAFLGVDNSMPLLHGSQGCTSFGLVLFVRHFREAIPMQTTAMSEVATVLGGFDNLEQALINIAERTHPTLIGICTTGISEIKGDDLAGFLKLIRTNNPRLNGIALVDVSTPDFHGTFQDGWAAAVTRMIEEIVEVPRFEARPSRRINVLPGCQITPGDIDELRDIFEAFSLDPVFLPDLSGSLDGHIPTEFTPTSLDGISVEHIRRMSTACWTVAIGEQMRGAAITLEHRTGVPYKLFRRLTGLAANDELMGFLSEISGVPVPRKYRRQRSQLIDAMLDGHFYFGGKRVAVAGEPDLLFTMSHWLHEMGCNIQAAVTTAESPVLESIPVDVVLVGDLEDLELRSVGADLIVTHSHGRQAAERLQIPFYRIGIPIFDRLGAGQQVTVGYQGTRDLIFDVGNLLMTNAHEPTPETWIPKQQQSHDLVQIVQ